MLVGIPPFYHQNQNFMFQLIAKGELRFPSQLTLNENAKNLITKVIFQKNIKKFKRFSHINFCF